MKVHEAKFVTSAVAPSGYPPNDRPEIAFAGRSNVGKSTLLNALVGIKQLAKISQKPGKTRLLNFFDVEGRFYMVDLPGYGWAKVSKEERMQWERNIESYLRIRETLACVVVLIDLRRGVGELDATMIDFLEEAEVPYEIVFTKADKLKGNERRKQIRLAAQQVGLDADQVMVTSGVKRDGVEQLWTKLQAYLT